MNPEVSICVVTYNQEQFVGECLESLISQQVSFEFEIIVSDDGSKDNTRSIISAYAQKYPHIVKPIFQAQNLGAFDNFVFTHKQATGKYIAHVDGDDYVLPGKLQAQYDFLEQHPECNILWHRMFVLNTITNEQKVDLVDVHQFPLTGISRSLLFCLMTPGAHSSKMYRSSVRDYDLPDFHVMDYFANIEQIRNKKAFFVHDKPLGVYRVGIGIASGSTYTRELMNKSFIYFSKKYPSERQFVNTASLFLLLADIKNGRKTWKLNLSTYLKTFHIKAFYNLFKYYPLYQMFRSPYNSIR